MDIPPVGLVRLGSAMQVGFGWRGEGGSGGDGGRNKGSAMEGRGVEKGWTMGRAIDNFLGREDARFFGLEECLFSVRGPLTL